MKFHIPEPGYTTLISYYVYILDSMMFCISCDQYKEPLQLICNTNTKATCELKEVYSEKAALIKQLQQVTVEKDKLLYRLLQAKKETSHLSEHISECVMESEQQSEVLMSVAQQNEKQLEIEWYVLHYVHYTRYITCGH